MNGYRRELKYIVTDDVLMDVKNRISTLMRPDEHQTGDHYGIRSIYCDSPGYRCYRENQAGVSTREKYRIRTYGCNEGIILAEIKIRHRETISKMSTRIGRPLLEGLISTEPGRAAAMLSKEMNDSSSGRTPAEKRVLEKYLARFAAEGFRPACIVDYERSAYVYDTSNVRITFDRNVFASREFDRMFDPELTGRPALDNGMHILEIKYDEFLPDEIRQVLGGMRLIRSSSSKYAMSLGRFNGGRE